MSSFRTLPVSLIDWPNPDLRTARPPKRIREMAESIASIGQLQPIGVVASEERYHGVYGLTRFLAVRFLGKQEIECRVLDADQAAQIVASGVENMQRADLTPVEEARYLRRLLDQHGRSVGELAAACGKSESWVRDRLEILLWPVEVLEAIARGELKVAVARELVLVEDPKHRAHYLDCAVTSGTTAAQMRVWREDWEAFARRNPPEDAPPPTDGAAPAYVAPEVLCWWCDQPRPVTTMNLLRVDPSCQRFLAEVKREAAARGE